ncbi:MAG: Mov34/MPN/PAD-1 family protein, partial [Verrucomicrobiota bacterium]|nr:Mov34/MPN/PAD-1 family protein [Verrucomicrobiota bacterium]
MNTSSYCRVPGSVLLFLAIPLLASSCGTSPGSRDNSNLTRDWARSSYRLPQQEGLRFKREARTASQDGNREVCGAILRDPGGDGTLKLVFAENESNGSHSYELSNSSVKRIRNIARSLGSGVIGSFHSHPASDATPGHNDISHAGVLS